MDVTAGTATAADTRTHHSNRIRLTQEETEHTAVLAARLALTQPAAVDHPRWIAAARSAGCELPVRLLQALRSYRNDPGPEGLLLVSQLLPIPSEALPPTPNAPESAELSATVPAAIAMLVGLQLGEVVAYHNEKRGALVQNVVPVRMLENSQSNGGSVSLQFHTENAFHPNRPDYVALLCLRSASREEAGTYVASIRQALPLLSEKDRAILRENRFVTSPPPSFRSEPKTEPHPLLSGDIDDPDVRVDFHATAALDDTGAKAMSRLCEALATVGSSLHLRHGDMVFLDNRLVVHGRSAFTPRYDGTDRWLHRVFVHLDNRRNRARRTAGGAVLM